MNLPLQELIDAITENTKALRDVLAASGTTTAPAPAPKAPKKAKAEPAPEVTPEVTPEPEETEETETPTPVPAATPAPKDTPHVPAPVAPGQPEAGEYVDVDEVISKIQSVVKSKMMNGDTEAVKKSWETYRKGLGIDRISELRNEPAKLLAALKKAEAL